MMLESYKLTTEDVEVISPTASSTWDEPHALKTDEMLSSVFYAVVRRRSKSRNSRGLSDSAISYANIEPGMSTNLASLAFDSTASGVDVVNGNGFSRASMSTSSVSIVLTPPEILPEDAEPVQSSQNGSNKTGVSKARSFGSSEHERQKTSRRSDSKHSATTERKSKKERRLQSQSEQFFRLFSDLDDVLLNSFHCALVQDILIQGVLYVTRHWFCFHSKLLGKKPAIRIQVADVVGITKMKTAGIIPNAVGVETNTDKFTFGSLMARQTTYRLMVEVWKTTHGKIERNEIDKSANEDTITDKLKPEIRDGMTSENDSSSMNSTDGESTTNKTANTSDVFTPTSFRSDQSEDLVCPSDSIPKPVEFLHVPSDEGRDLSSASTSSDHSDDISLTTDDVSRSRGHASHPMGVPQSVEHLSSQPANFRSFCVLLLMVSAVLLMVLTFITVILAFKVVRLQTLVEVRSQTYTESINTRHASDVDLRFSDGRLIDVDQLNEILDSHKRLLEQMNHSLIGLTDLTHEKCLSLQSADCKSTT